MLERIVLLAILFSLGCSRSSPKPEELKPTTTLTKSGLVATSSPNPCDQHTSPSIPRPPHPFMWYYRTEVRNTLSVPLRIVRFEAYKEQDGRWVAGNVTGRSLTAKDFDDWYSDGIKIKGGEIPPGETALNAVNWHGSSSPSTSLTKWAFWAIDPSGAQYYAESVVESIPIRK